MLQAGGWNASWDKDTCCIADLLLTFFPRILVVFLSNTKFTYINQINSCAQKYCKFLMK